MSIRAYRQVARPQLADDATFNLWYDTEVLESLQVMPSAKIMGGETDVDFIELNVDELDALLQAPSPFSEDITAAFRKDIEAAKEKGEEYILYHCH